MDRRWIDFILDALREGETLRGEGMTVEEICRRIGVAEPTYRRWLREYAGSFEAPHSPAREEANEEQTTPNDDRSDAAEPAPEEAANGRREE
ncbi:MAG: helix-turn-helix domain-containing protein [Candidatus Eisenbacteria bacterium]|nr:helix-turn-helix domain-containing protein [Candidatus Eisenbacteria bacterium]